MLQPDLGTSLVFAAILAGMLWMSGASLRWLLILAAGVIAMVPIAWTYILRDYQKARLTDFLNATPDIQGAGFQLHQAQIAVGAGGLIGKGLTNGNQTQGDLLPVQATDFVFATLAEELGFIGALVMFILFVLLLWRVLVAGWRSRDAFGTLFAAGVACDDRVPAHGQRRDGPRDHADHGHPAAVRDPRRGVAREHGRRAWASSRASTSDRARPFGDHRHITVTGR